MDPVVIGARLKELRAGRNRADVANRLSISLSALAMYERGERIPRDEVKKRFAQLYGKTVQEIFYDA